MQIQVDTGDLQVKFLDRYAKVMVVLNMILRVDAITMLYCGTLPVTLDMETMGDQ